MAWVEDPKYLAAYSKASAVGVWCLQMFVSQILGVHFVWVLLEDIAYQQWFLYAFVRFLIHQHKTVAQKPYFSR